ncbi:MAG: phosphotransferase, partial [Bacteroidota bacterium]
PFDPSNLFPLDDIQHGLKKRAKSITDNNSIKEKVNQLGKIYLSKGGTLCHGDFYPGSIMITKRHGLRVIDPEFSFPGPKEWDLAVFVAHLYLAQTHISLIQKSLDLFTGIDDLDESLFWGFVGTEIIRRLIGLAQLPLELTLQEKEDLLQQACLFILK